VSDVRAFFGLASYYTRFVKNFATIAEPLSKLTCKGTTFRWTQEAQTAFEKLKQALINAVTLVYPQPGLIFTVDTDASDVARGAVLSIMVEGVERPVAFFSRFESSSEKLLPDQTRVVSGGRGIATFPAILAWSKCRHTN